MTLAKGDLSSSSRAMERVVWEFHPNPYTHITAITHGGLLVSVTISKPGVSLQYSCPEPSGIVPSFDDVIKHLQDIRDKLGDQVIYSKVSGE